MFQNHTVRKSIHFCRLNFVAADREHQTLPNRGNLVVSGAENSYSKGSVFNPWSCLSADFSTHSLKFTPMAEIKLQGCENASPTLPYHGSQPMFTAQVYTSSAIVS
jgi:hypothetical protein